VVRELRLYCLAANEHVVFLFNGGIKTEFEAKDCPNVGKYIKQANRIVKSIDAHFNHEIIWNDSYTDIIFNSDLEFKI